MGGFNRARVAPRRPWPHPRGNTYSAPAESPVRNAWGVHGGSNTASVMAGNHSFLSYKDMTTRMPNSSLLPGCSGCRRDGRI